MALEQTGPCEQLPFVLEKSRYYSQHAPEKSMGTLGSGCSCFVLQTREQLCASRVKEQPRPGGLFSGLCKSTHLTPLLLVYLVLISMTDLVAWLGGGVGKTNHQLPNQPESFGTISRLKLPAGLSAVTPPPGCSQSA